MCCFEGTIEVAERIPCRKIDGHLDVVALPYVPDIGEREMFAAQPLDTLCLHEGFSALVERGKPIGQIRDLGVGDRREECAGDLVLDRRSQQASSSKDAGIARNHDAVDAQLQC